VTDLEEVNLTQPYETAMADEESRREFYAAAQALLADNKQVREDHKNLWLRCLAAERERDDLRKDAGRWKWLEANADSATWESIGYQAPMNRHLHVDAAMWVPPKETACP